MVHHRLLGPQEVPEKLLTDGITAFTHPLDELLASLKEKRRVVLERQAPERAEFGALALREFAQVERGSGGKDQWEVNSPAGLCH